MKRFVALAIFAALMFTGCASAQAYPAEDRTPASLFGRVERQQIQQLQKQIADQNTAVMNALQVQLAQQQAANLQLVGLMLQQQKAGPPAAAPAPIIQYHIYPQGTLPIAPPQQVLPIAPPQQVLPIAPPQQVLPIAPPQQKIPIAPPQQILPIEAPQQNLPITPKQPQQILPIAPPGPPVGYQQFTRTDWPPAGYAVIRDREGVTRLVPAARWTPAK